MGAGMARKWRGRLQGMRGVVAGIYVPTATKLSTNSKMAKCNCKPITQISLWQIHKSNTVADGDIALLLALRN